jgi:hypothetical protein
MSRRAHFKAISDSFPPGGLNSPAPRRANYPSTLRLQLRCRIHRREVAQILTCPIQGFQGAAIIVWSEYGL